MGELTLEELASKLDAIHKTANIVKADVDEIKERDHPMHMSKRANENEEDYKARVAQEMEDKKKEAEEKEEMKEARKARYSAVKAAMGEHDEEKRDAALRAAMAQTDPTENTIRNDKERTAEEEEKEKENNAAVASIIGDKRQEFINKILTANKVFNASNIKEVEKRVMKASLSKLKTEYKTIEPFIAQQVQAKPAEQSPPVIPYFASMMTPEDVDIKQLNANSPDSAFAQISTKELLEMAE